MIANALEDKPLPVYGDGANVRDWIFVTDHCEGIVEVMDRGRAGEVYNLGGNAEEHNIDVVKAILAPPRQAGEPDSSTSPIAPATTGATRWTSPRSSADPRLGGRRHDLRSARTRADTVRLVRRSSASGGNACGTGAYRDYYEKPVRRPRLLRSVQRDGPSGVPPARVAAVTASQLQASAIQTDGSAAQIHQGKGAGYRVFLA